MKENKTTFGGISFTGLLTILFIGLKLTGFINWSWVWVLSPIWIQLILVLAICIIVFIVLFFKDLFRKS